MIKTLKKLLTNWIAHFLMMLIAITAFTMIPYLYHVHTWGNYIVNTDGTPVTGLQYATNLKDERLFVVALFIFLTEAVRQFLFKKYHFIVFIVGWFIDRNDFMCRNCLFTSACYQATR